MKAMGKVLGLLVLIISFNSAWTQKFTVELKKDGIISATGLGLLVSTRIIEHKLPGLNDLQIQSLAPVNELDAFFNPSVPKRPFHVASDVLIFTEIGMTLGIQALLAPESEKRALLLMTMEGYLLNQGVADAIKLLARRPRPFLISNSDLYPKHETDARLSFYSGHTANAAFFATLMVSTLSELEMIKSGWTIPLIVAVPSVMGYMRIRAGKHYFTDVLIGAIMGTGIGYLIPRIHETKFQRKEDKEFSLSYFDSGKIGLFIHFN